MSKRSRLKLLDASLLAALIFFVTGGVDLVPFHGDEATLISMSRDYHHRFVERDLERLRYDAEPANPEAQALRLLNGTIPKYTIGIGWHLSGFPIERVNDKWVWGRGWDWNIAQQRLPSDDLLAAARRPNALVTAASVVALFFLMRQWRGRAAAIAASAFLASHSVVLVHGRRAVMEAPLLFFSVAIVGIAMAWIRSRAGKNEGTATAASLALRSWSFAVALALATGFAVASKHNGTVPALAAYSAVLAFGLADWRRAKRSPSDAQGVPNSRTSLLARLGGNSLLVQLGASLALALATFVFLNPAWWDDPLSRPFDVLELRRNVVANQARLHPDHVYSGAAARFGGLVREISTAPTQYFEATDWEATLANAIPRYEHSAWSGIRYAGAGGVLGMGLLALTLLGLWRFALDLRAKPFADGGIVVAAWCGIALLFTLVAIPIAWQRHYMALYPVQAVLVGSAMAWLLRNTAWGSAATPEAAESAGLAGPLDRPAHVESDEDRSDSAARDLERTRWRFPSVEIGLFCTLIIAYAFFAQGGGWNQNARFAQVRALVETGSLAINDYVSYAVVDDATGRRDLERVPVPSPTPAYISQSAGDFVSLDLAYASGRLYPNKPPGLSIAAAPSYVLARAGQHVLGSSPDHWWALTWSHYLTTVGCIGVLGALGCALFYRTSRRLFPEVASEYHATAALVFGLATLWLPFSTLFFDHIAAATFAFASFALLIDIPDDRSAAARSTRSTRLAALAGGAAALAVTISYTAAINAAALGAFALWRTRSLRVLAFYAAGCALPAIALLAHHHVSFGSAFTTPNELQIADWMQGGAPVMGLFGFPDPGHLVELLASPYRGLFFSSPVLLLCLAAWLQWLRRGVQRDLAVLCVGVFTAHLLVNAAFHGWYGGSTFGARYLIPALPFFALPLARVLRRVPRTAIGLAAVSAAMMLLATAVNPQVPGEFRSPFGDYLVPIATRASEGQLAGRAAQVAVNRVGIYEIAAGHGFAPGSPQGDWNAFNLGEFLFPRSLASLLPLLAILGVAGAAVVRTARASEPGETSASEKLEDH